MGVLMPMKLSRLDRIKLAQNFQILAKLYPDESAWYNNAAEVLRSGYELLYDEIFQGVYDDKDVLDEKTSLYVMEVLAMYDNMNYAMTRLKDKPDVSEYDLKFPGFDGNNEPTLLGFANFFCRTRNAFERVLVDGRILNSHMPTGDLYERMLTAYRLSEDKNRLTGKDIERILEAQPYPKDI